MLKSYPKHLTARVNFFFVVCLASYLLIDFSLDDLYEINWFLYPTTLALPCSFWLVSKAYFDDNFKLSKWIIFLVIGFVGFQMMLFQLDNVFDFSDSASIILMLLPHLTTLLFIILAIVEAARNYSGDLLLSRYRFRLVFISATAILMILTVLTEVTFHNDVPGSINLLQKATILIMIYYFTFDLLQFKSDFFQSTKVEPAPEKEAPTVDAATIDHLMSLMEQQKIYKTEGLTIPLLAQKMNIKEYKLRQAINQHLGFRNFNDFLNAYRIEEAKEVLSKKENRQLTILEIAYNLGYASLAPFNKAFKHKTGMTPTEFRQISVDSMQ